MKFPEKILDLCKILEDEKCENIVIFDSDRTKSDVDYYILATAKDVTHIKDVSSKLILEYSLRGYGELAFEGYNLTKWVSFDCDEAIINVLTADERTKYNMDKLSNYSNQTTFDSVKKFIKKTTQKTIKKEEKKLKRKEKVLKKQEKVEKKKGSKKDGDN